MPVQLDPRVLRFQALKAERKARKLKEIEALNKIKAVNPNLTDRQALQVHQAHVKINQGRVIQVHGRSVKVFNA